MRFNYFFSKTSASEHKRHIQTVCHFKFLLHSYFYIFQPLTSSNIHKRIEIVHYMSKRKLKRWRKIKSPLAYCSSQCSQKLTAN